MHRRLLEADLAAALADTPVVIIQGPRQAGKTTLVRELLKEKGDSRRYVTLDRTLGREAATNDPEAFLKGLGPRVTIDEAQFVPELALAIKASVDVDRRPGRFLLTGSADMAAFPQMISALVGRSELLSLWPLSQLELEGGSDNLVDALFNGLVVDAPACTIDDVLSRALAGGFPEALSRSDAQRRIKWFDAYIGSVFQRDIPGLARIQGLAELPRLLSLIAARTSALLNQSDLARDAALPPTTLKRYLALIEAAFLARTLPAWHVNLSKRIVKSPKLLMVDTALAAALLGTDREGLKARHLVGPFVETFAATEVLKLLGSAATRARAHHFRTHAGLEVDLVLEDAAGRVVAFEIKSSQRVRATDFRGLRALADHLGDRFLAGVVLHCGEGAARFADRQVALPLSALWSPQIADGRPAGSRRKRA